MSEIDRHLGVALGDKVRSHDCTMCGKCCRWPGYVVLYPNDLIRLAQGFNTSASVVVETYCQILRFGASDSEQLRLILRRTADHIGCIFLSGNQCSVHTFKPLVCQAGPAGWIWIAHPDFFDYYLVHSPGFAQPTERLRSTPDAEELFLDTWENELAARVCNDIPSLSHHYRISVTVLDNVQMVYLPGKEHVRE